MIIDNNSIATTEDWTQKIENGCVWLWTDFGTPMCGKGGFICGLFARNPRACPIGKSLKDSCLEKIDIESSNLLEDIIAGKRMAESLPDKSIHEKIMEQLAVFEAISSIKPTALYLGEIEKNELEKMLHDMFDGDKSIETLGKYYNVKIYEVKKKNHLSVGFEKGKI